MNSSVVYYTDGRLKKSIADYCHKNLLGVLPEGMRIIEIYQGEDVKRSHKSMINNILTGVRVCNTEFVYLAEHDILYPPDYFIDTEYPNSFMVTMGGYYLDRRGYYKRNGRPLSAFSGRKAAWIYFLEGCLEEIETRGKLKWCEPNARDYSIAMRLMSVPYVDIRHGQNFTGGRNGNKYRETIPYWKRAKKLWEELGCTA